MSKPFRQTVETKDVKIAFDMIYVAGGSFRMGSEAEEAFDREQPVHSVQVPDFHLGRFLVTQALWQAVMGENPSWLQGDDRPVEQVSWEDCHLFIDRLNAKTGKAYRLPTEAEWEYAARGGSLSEGYLYAGSDELEEVAWYGANSGNQSQPVGLKLPNELGIYDMSGNVLEWCEDDWHGSYEGAPADGSAWIDSGNRGTYRVCRGGHWLYSARRCRVSYRGHDSPGYRFNRLGFRLACSPRSGLPPVLPVS